VRALARRSEERPFKVRPEDQRVARGQISNGGQGRREAIYRISDQANDRASRAMCAMDAKRMLNSVCAIVEGKSSGTVTVQIDEARSQPRTRRIDDLAVALGRRQAPPGAAGACCLNRARPEQDPEAVDHAVNVSLTCGMNDGGRASHG
jgi:hypothetical protein